MLRLHPKTRLERPDDFAWVCAVAGGLCILIHLLTLGNRDAIRALGFAPSGAPAYTLLTSMFVHASWAHLVGNMLFLLVFGPPVERTLGHRKTLLLYLGAGVA